MACKIGLPKLFAYTLFKSADYEERCVYAFQFYFLGWIFEVFWLYMALSLNTCLCIDLMLMIKYPFVKKEKFMNWYLTISIIASLIVAVRIRYLIDGELGISENVIFLVSYFIFVIIAITSSVLAYKYLG